MGSFENLSVSLCLFPPQPVGLITTRDWSSWAMPLSSSSPGEKGSSLIDTAANWSWLQHYPPTKHTHTHISLSTAILSSLTVYLCLSQPHCFSCFQLIQDSDLLVIGNLFSPFASSIMTWNSKWQLAISCLRLLSGMQTVLLTPRWAWTLLPNLSLLLIIRSYY